MKFVISLKFIIAIITILSCVMLVSSDDDPLSKSAFKEIGCKGAYKRKLFTSVNLVCDDCHNLFRETVVYNICRQNCFMSDHFMSCLWTIKGDSKSEIDTYKNMIKQLYGNNIEL